MSEQQKPLLKMYVLLSMVQVVSALFLHYCHVVPLVIRSVNVRIRLLKTDGTRVRSRYGGDVAGEEHFSHMTEDHPIEEL